MNKAENILVIEGNPVTTQILLKLLTDINHADSVITFCLSLSEAAQLSKNNYSFIISSFSFPDSVGTDTLHYIRLLFTETPLIFLAGSTDESAARTVLENGDGDYLDKNNLTKNDLEKAILRTGVFKNCLNLYNNFFVKSPAPMFIFDGISYQFLAVNEAAIRQYGYTAEEFLALSADNIRPFEERSKFRDTSSNIPSDYQDVGRWKHLKKNGETFFIHAFSRRFEFKGRDARLTFISNIDELVKGEAELEKKAQQLGIVAENISSGFVLFNNYWEYLYINKEAKRILRIENVNVIGKTFFDLFPDARNYTLYQQGHHVFNENLDIHFEEYYHAGDIWFSVNAYPTGEGMAVYFNDVTEQKRAQEKIYNDEQMLRSVINNTQDAIWCVDKHLDIMIANQPFWDHLSSIVGKQTRELKGSDHSKETGKAWTDFYKRAFSGESFKIIWTDSYANKKKYQDISFSPFFDRENKLAGVSCFSRDITEQKEHLDKIKAYNQQLIKISWLQSHEMRRPVANLLGLVEVIDFDNFSNPANKELLEHVREETFQLDRIIRDVTQSTEMDEDSPYQT